MLSYLLPTRNYLYPKTRPTTIAYVMCYKRRLVARCIFVDWSSRCDIVEIKGGWYPNGHRNASGGGLEKLTAYNV